MKVRYDMGDKGKLGEELDSKMDNNCRQVYIETERLILRSWQESDLPSFERLNDDQDVMKFFPNHLTKTETRGFYDRIQEHFRKHDFGLYAVELKVTGEFIGFIGFSMTTFQAEFTPCIEIGWRIHRDHWRKGYATEGAKACLDFGFHVLGFDEIYSFTAQINYPSYGVMAKIGMVQVGTFDHPRVVDGDPLKPHVLYKIV